MTIGSAPKAASRALRAGSAKGVRFGGAFHNAWTILKLILIAVFIIAGFAIGNTQSTSFAPSTSDLAVITGAPFAISDVQPPFDFAHLEHLIAQNDLLPIPRPGRHSHFSVRLALDDDGDPIAGREFFENFFLDVCSH
jgi:hypothetical protein